MIVLICVSKPSSATISWSSMSSDIFRSNVRPRTSYFKW